MLPKDLLITYKRKGNIKPKYLKNINLAEILINIFQKFIGIKYKELQEKLEELEQGEKNYKIIRGMSFLLKRRCEFEINSILNCTEVRMFLFERGFVINEDERDKVFEEASKYFNASKEEIEEAFFSDLQEEQILKKFNPISSLELIEKYNLSLTQTLLFDALELTFVVEGNYQKIFRQINYLGLIYEIEENEIKVTGPGSLFKNTKKYGTSLAKLLPHITNTDKWKIKAKIETKWGNEPRIYNFELNSYEDILLPHYTEPITHFDSEVEAQFYHDFKIFNLGWEIKREPTIIKAGKYVTIPDFGFYKYGLVCYLEVVGFWTPEYLKKKIWKLKNAEHKIIVAVNQNLNCRKEDFTGEVIFYKKKIPLKPIIKILKEMEQKHIQKEITNIQKIEIKKEMVLIKEKAKELNIIPEALIRLNIPNYFIIGDKIVSQRYLDKLKEEIGNEREYKEIEIILEKYKLTPKALDYVGYKIMWKGIMPVKIIKKN